MREMRLTIIRDSKHYIKQCANCCCMLTQGTNGNKRHNDTVINNEVSDKAISALADMDRVSLVRSLPFGSIDRIEEIQFEPSFPCNLKCPGCLHGFNSKSLSTEDKPYLFPIEWFIKIIDSLMSNAIKVNRISFVGRGEPTLNKDLIKMVEYARCSIPSLTICMDTNSTQEFKEEYLDMTWINCSIDGSTEEAYKTYRRSGDFDKAIKFMRDAVKFKVKNNKKCLIKWKYILFDTTDKQWQLDMAQKLAADIGIDELNFVMTACGAFDNSVLPSKEFNSLSKIQSYINSNKIFRKTITTRS